MIKTYDIECLPDVLKQSIKRLREILETCSLPGEKDLIQKILDDRRKVNEPQFLDRLERAQSDPERFKLTTYQYAVRAKLLNSVLRYRQESADHQPLLQTAGRIVRTVMQLLDRVEPELRADVARECVIASGMISLRTTDPNHCLELLDEVHDLPRATFIEAMVAIFEDQKLVKPQFGARAYDFFFIEVGNVNGIEATLKTNCLKLQKVFYAMRKAAQELRSCKSKLNPRQYSERLEQASIARDEDSVQRIQADRKRTQANYYCAAVEFLYVMKMLEDEISAMEVCIDEAFSSVEKSDIDSIVQMNNCIAAKKWLVEARDQMELAKAKESDADEAIASFDPAQYCSDMAETVKS